MSAVYDTARGADHVDCDVRGQVDGYDASAAYSGRYIGLGDVRLDMAFAWVAVYALGPP